MLLVRQRTQGLLSLKGLLARHGLSGPGADTLKKWTADEAQDLALADENDRFQVETLLASIRNADALVRAMEGRVKATLEARPEYQRLQVVPVIGPILGMVIVLESGEFARFPSAGDYASYCRAVKSERSSNVSGKRSTSVRGGSRRARMAG